MLFVFKTNFKVNKIKIGLCLLLGCLILLIADSSLADNRVLFKGIVKSFKLNVRAEPSEFSTVVRVIEKGGQVDIIEEGDGVGGWLTVIFQGKKGYIRNRPRYISLVPVGKSIKTKSGLKKNKRKQLVIASKIAAQEKISTEEKKVAAFFKKEMKVIEGLNAIDYGLNQARLRSRALSQEVKDLEIKNAKIHESRTTLKAQIDKEQVYAGQRLNALYRMGMIGRLDIVGESSSVFDFFLTQNAMKQVINSDLQILEQQARDLKKLSRMEVKLSQQVKEKIDLEAELNFQIRIKEKETSKKEAILYEVQGKKKLAQAVLASLKVSARDLDERLNLMNKKGQLFIDDSSFLRQKGRLQIPVKGKIVSKFGPSKNGDYKAFTFQSGIDIKAERGEPVRSVFKGEVMFAQWLKGYGNLMIINHGDNYYTLYAHVEEIFKKKGEIVDTGEVIATAGDTGSVKGLLLHFEVRHHGKPINPLPWIRKGA
ncbi:MAG: peptidoglycan DD-metalloendopeptidase family protein [Desulfobacteraceae bacterium]|nr:peptidoglycan DD-metalloendopeptidase family protein [Desulfobacteraceae bacterium]